MFEKVDGGQLLNRIQERDHFTEREASQIIRDLANALNFLHSKGIDVVTYIFAFMFAVKCIVDRWKPN